MIPMELQGAFFFMDVLCALGFWHMLFVSSWERGGECVLEIGGGVIV